HISPTHHPLPLPSPRLPPPSSPLLLPSTNHRADILEVVLSPRKRLCLAPGPRFKVGEGSFAARPTRGYRVDYGFILSLDAELRHDRRVTDLVTTVRQDTYEIYVRFEDAQDDRAILRGQTTSLQTRLIAALGCIDTLEARDLAHTDDLEDADSCIENQVKFATCTLHGIALTWWNSHVKTELALLYGRIFPEVSDEVEKYVDGLPNMIQGNVMSTKPKTMEKAIEMANKPMDHKLYTLAERQIENKKEAR
ncbi:hypothetical protein Tco_1389079, partial [Tanacetum coccineum]